ncbi:hypothetical protein ACHAWF_018301 [Thalassiosira exigua]
MREGLLPLVPEGAAGRTLRRRCRRRCGGGRRPIRAIPRVVPVPVPVPVAVPHRTPRDDELPHSTLPRRDVRERSDGDVVDEDDAIADPHSSPKRARRIDGEDLGAAPASASSFPAAVADHGEGEPQPPGGDGEDEVGPRAGPGTVASVAVALLLVPPGPPPLLRRAGVGRAGVRPPRIRAASTAAVVAARPSGAEAGAVEEEARRLAARARREGVAFPWMEI